MKRTVLAAFCIIALCSLGLAMKTGTISAYQVGYEVTDYWATRSPTFDGNWTTPSEWTDAEVRQLDGTLNATFRLKWDGTSDMTTYHQCYLIEFFDDNTNDTGDYWQICCTASIGVEGDPTGGTTPQIDCFRLDYVGHSHTGFTFYTGDGTEWVEATAAWPGDVYIKDSLGTSPLSDTPHWIAEIKINHLAYGMRPNFWIYVAAYDESNSTAGVQSWPDGSSDVPNDWGFMDIAREPIPEGLTIGVMVLLSSVSVLIASHYFRKRSRPESCRTGKT